MFWNPPRVVAAIALLLGIVVGPGRASAHPHILISLQAEVMYGADGKITALRQSWTYDRAYSAFAVRGLETGGDGRLSAVALSGLAKSQIEAFAPHGYFTRVKAGNDTLELAEPRDYGFAQNVDGLLTLNFTLPLRTRTNASELTLEIHDPNFFAYFTMADGKNALHLAGAPPGCGADVSGPKAIDLTQPASISSAFWKALRSSEKGLPQPSTEFVNRIVVTCQ